MKKEIVVNKDNNEVTICLSLKKRIMARDPRMTITTKMVQTMLENDDFKLDKCISHDTIDNHDNNSRHDGTWIFSLFVEKTQKLALNNKKKENIDAPPSVAPQKKAKTKKRTYKKKES